MRISRSVFLMIVFTPLFVLGQDSVSVPGPAQGAMSGGGIVTTAPGRPIGVATAGGVMIHREMGTWWKDSKLTKQLQLKDSQISQLNQIFYDHRLKLIDYGAEMEKADFKLQNLLDADVPNESQVGAQVDQVLAARGKLEREYTMMNLDLRKVLTVDQWKQLKSIREERGPAGNVFFKQRTAPGGPDFFYKKLPEGPDAPPLPPPPGPGGDDMF
jgi:Spy/CpxP family protein refolding chaperone